MRFGSLQLSLQLSLLCLESHELILNGQSWDAILDRLNQLANFSLDLSKFTAGAGRAGVLFHPQPIHLFRIFVAEFLEEILAHQLVAHGIEDALFYL